MRGLDGLGGITRVLICENDPLMRAALCDLIRSDDTLELVGAATDADEGALLAAETRPDAVLLDVRMPKGGGPRAARLISDMGFHTRLVAFSAHTDRSAVLEMLRAGASEYLVKGVDDHDLIDALKRTGRGRIGLSSAELEQLVFEVVDKLRESPLPREAADETVQPFQVLSGQGGAT